MGDGLKRNNHYLAQMYLAAWINEKNKVKVYNLLVPNENFPIWKDESLRSVGSFDSIFVRFDGSKEIDDIEDWFNEKYETPSKEALSHAISGDRVTIEEWHYLIDFLACHIVRSPVFLIKTLDFGKEFQDIFDKEVKKISEMSNDELKKSIKEHKEKNKEENNDYLFPFKMTKLDEIENDKVVYNCEVMVGKQFYLWNIKNLLENTAAVLHKHKWGIITVDERVSLPSSDDPVICLNYNNDNDYNFGGGWGRENSNILFPISPSKILYTQVGCRVEPRWQADYKTSLFLKKIIIEHSHRIVISSFEDDDVERIKPRYVDLNEFKREKEMWKDFQKNYLENEKEYIRDM